MPQANGTLFLPLSFSQRPFIGEIRLHCPERGYNTTLETTMQHTVVGAFDQYSEAEQAVRTLQSSGFKLASVTQAQTGASTAGSTSAPDEGVMGHIKGFFGGLFGEEDHHASYAEAVRRGGAVVKVDVDTEDEAHRARKALEDAGAADIDERGDAWRKEGWTGSKVPAGVTPKAAVATEGAIPVIKEELAVGKRTVSTGGVRVFARTVSTPVHESVDLRSEHADVQRRIVDRVATAADLNALQDRTIEVRETAERAVVSKTARVVEEVSVGKTVENRTEQIKDSVRHTEIEVERLGAESGDYAKYDSAYRTDFATRYGATGAAYGDYEPAYKYGHGLRSDPRYSGRQWADVEGDARRGWETSHPGSAWEKVKGAVSHAWTSVTK